MYNGHAKELMMDNYQQRHRQHFKNVRLTVRINKRHHASIILEPNRRIRMTNVTVNVGHSVTMTLTYLDQNGNPMLTPPTPDSPPSWSDTTPATGTLTEQPGNLEAIETAVAPGNDVVSVSVVVGGQTFSASLGITVQAAPQVLTSVEITPVVN
jgi:hypothetical protein